MDLILWRHAEAQEPEGDMTDLDRALTRRGDKQAARMAAWLEAQGVALDVAHYRDAPPGLRIWCGATVERADVEALPPWLDAAWEACRQG